MNKPDDGVDYEAYRVASILACLPANIRGSLVESLQIIKPDIGFLALRFEDLLHADDSGIQALIRAVNTTDLVLALSCTELVLRQRFYDNMGSPGAKMLAEDVASRLQNGSIEQDMDAFEAKINIVAIAAKLRQNGQLTVNPIGFHPDYVTDEMIHSIQQELQQACEKAMADVLTHNMPEVAAAVLCRRLDRSQILQQMLQLDEFESYGILSEDEIDQLLTGLEDFPGDDDF
ncbi:MAG: hypothetical protein HRT35_32585 [Algicola sp.]|nr:hypothetical protein [Algicola sp.]